jgi:uroporphyrinogen-III synthase
MSDPRSTASPTAADGALAGVTIVLTRPAGSARAFARHARVCGAKVLALPGLALSATADADADAARAALRPAGGFDDWVFISPAAVRFAFQLVPDLRPGVARVFAVGAGTRRALAHHGLDAFMPTTRSDSEGLLALPSLGAVRGRRIAVVGAPGGRDLIAPAFRARGAAVEPIHVYRRAPPRLTRRHFDALERAAEPWITLLSSGEALANLVRLLPPDLLARLRRHTLVVSSTRLAALARGHAFTRIVVAESAGPGAMLGAAREALAAHRP